MEGGREEDDMKEGDLGDGMAARSSSRMGSKGDPPEQLLAHTKLSKRGSSDGTFPWTPCTPSPREELRDSGEHTHTA